MTDQLERAEFSTLTDIRERAREKLSDGDWAYLETGTGDEVTLRENVEAFSRRRFHQPLYSGISSPVTAVRFLDIELAFPLVTAPFAFDTTFHADGHLAVGRAAEKAGIAQIAPMEGSFSLQDVAAASSAAVIYQVLTHGEPRLMIELSERARTAGYRYLCASFTPIRAWRETQFRARWQAPEDRLTNGVADAAELVMRERSAAFSEPRWDWTTARRIFADCALPWICKGVLSEADANRALEAGASALYVSNFGGRQLDRVPATIDVLPRIRQSVGPDVPILVDSGIRRGSDIATALALGANAVAAGRLVARGLAADGESGVLRTFELLREEFWTTLGHLGLSSATELSPAVFCD